MLPITKKLQLVLIGLLCSFLTAFAITTLFARLPRSWDLARNFDLFCYNICFTSTLRPHPRLMIIDRNDPQETGLRRDYAKMINRLNRAGAKCIALDIRFILENADSAAANQALVDSVAACPQVILAMDFSSTHRPADELMLDEMKRFALPDSVCDILIPRIVASGVDLPFYRLLRVAKHLSHINTFGEYHHFPPVILFDESCYASLPLEIARCYFADSADTGLSTVVSAHGNQQILNDFGRAFDFKQIPLDGDGQILVNFIPKEKFEAHKFSWHGAFGLIDSTDRFRDAVVIIINSAGEHEINSPLGPYPRWALLASVTSQILLNRHIDTSVLFYPAFISALIGGVGIFLFLFVAPRLDKKWRKTRVVFVGGSITFFLIIILMLRWWQIWLGVLVPLFVYNTSMMVVRQRYYQMVRAPQYQNFGIAVLERKQEGYPIKIVEAPGGTEERDLILEPSFMEEDKFKLIFENLMVLQAKEDEIRWVGDKLFEALFPDEAFYILKSSLEQVRHEGKNLRLILQLDPPELVRLPWELMRSSRLPPGRLVLNRRISLVRHLPLAQPFSRKPYRVPLKILVIVSGSAGLDVEGEKELIKRALRLLVWGGDVRLRFCEHATLEDLHHELEREPDVLHYIGHGKFDEKNNASYLEFETESGECDSVSGDTLGELLHESSVRLVVLNSCESATASEHDALTGVAQTLVNVGVPAVVAMQFRIFDDTAKIFSKAFYSTLITNYSIEAAVTQARMSIRRIARQDLLGWATPVLFMRTQNGAIFELEQ